MCPSRSVVIYILYVHSSDLALWSLFCPSIWFYLLPEQYPFEKSRRQTALLTLDFAFANRLISSCYYPQCIYIYPKALWVKMTQNRFCTHIISYTWKPASVKQDVLRMSLPQVPQLAVANHVWLWTHHWPGCDFCAAVLQEAALPPSRELRPHYWLQPRGRGGSRRQSGGGEGGLL